MKATQIGVEAENRRLTAQQAKAKKAADLAIMRTTRKLARRAQRAAQEALDEILLLEHTR